MLFVTFMETNHYAKRHLGRLSH